MNSYLGEIAGICGINKPLTMHIARHSFAWLALANGVSMEIIARMLGHSDIRTTKIYAKVIDKSIAEQMSGLQIRLPEITIPKKCQSPGPMNPHQPG